MAQHDYVLAKQSGLGFRSDANNALAAVVSQNSGAAQPSTTYAYQLWADTNAGLLKIRNAANNGWVSLYSLDGTSLLIPPADGAVTLAKLADGVLAASTAGRLKMADEFVTAGKLAPAAVTPAKLSQPFTRATAVTASGSAVDFTGIPSWARRVTVILDGVSTTGDTDDVALRIGDSGGIETTGYAYYTSAEQLNAGAYSTSIIEYTTRFGVQWQVASTNRYVVWKLYNITGNTWVAEHNLGARTSATYIGTSSGAGSKELTGTLDRVQVFASDGATFDAGTINIIYEG